MTSERYRADDGWVMYRRPTRLEPTVLCKRCSANALAGWVFLGAVPLSIEHTLVCAGCNAMAISEPGVFHRALAESQAPELPEVDRLRGWLQWRVRQGQVSYDIEPRFMESAPLHAPDGGPSDVLIEPIPWWEAALKGMPVPR
jgi:hypothetical protein